MRRRAAPEAWPVMLCAAILIVVTVVVGVKLDGDSASIDPDRYERFREHARQAAS